MKNSIKIAVLAACAMVVVSCSKEKAVNENVLIPETLEIAKIMVEDTVENKRSIVFITGYDKGSNTFYKDAKDYFLDLNVEIIETAYSIQEIILWMNINYNDMPYADIHIVNDNKWKELSFETTVKGPKISSLTIHESLGDGLLPKLNNVLDIKARFIFHAANLGTNIALLDGFKQAFTADVEPTIVASEMQSVFGGEFTSHYLAKPYYAFYPTANSPGRVDLAKQFIASYPETNIDWLSVMNNQEERYQGDIYSYKFNIPVYWEFEYLNDEDVPSFKNLNELRAWMLDNDKIASDLEQMGIPIERFRLYEKVKGSKLIIKGKVTGVCVLEPVMSNAYPSEYIIPNIDNLRLYDTL